MTVTEIPAGVCQCAKARFSSKQTADRAVVNAKIKRQLRGNQKRREERAYRCPADKNTWHLTSQSCRPSGLPTYPVTDDAAAQAYITLQVDHPREDAWEALLQDNRVRQTERILHRIQLDCVAARDGTAGKTIDKEAKTRAFKWEVAVRERLVVARAAVKQLNIRESSGERAEDHAHTRDVLRRLALALDNHRTHTADPTEHDRQLWAWLDVLAISHGAGRTTLRALIDGAAWTPDPCRPRSRSD